MMSKPCTSGVGRPPRPARMAAGSARIPRGPVSPSSGVPVVSPATSPSSKAFVLITFSFGMTTRRPSVVSITVAPRGSLGSSAVSRPMTVRVFAGGGAGASAMPRSASLGTTVKSVSFTSLTRESLAGTTSGPMPLAAFSMTKLPSFIFVTMVPSAVRVPATVVRESRRALISASVAYLPSTVRNFPSGFFFARSAEGTSSTSMVSARRSGSRPRIA